MTVEGSMKLATVLCVAYFSLQVGSRMPRLRPDPTKPPRDYRPSKWLTNSAMDVWYGNKSVVEILSREFKDLVDKLSLRSVRATSLNREFNMENRTKWIENHDTLDNSTNRKKVK